jgi:subfamily B ATP-binding cassette protein MsbA
MLSGNAPGALAALFTYDANTARLAVCDVFLVAGKDTLTIVTMIGLMFYTNWRLALMCLVLPVLAVIPMRMLGKQMRTISRMTQLKVGDLTRGLAEVFQGIKTVKSFGLEQREKSRLGQQMSHLARLVVKAAWVGGAILPVVDGIGGLAVASVILVGGVQVISHTVTPGQLFVFVSAIVGAYASIPSLSKVNITLQTGLAAAERIFTFLDHYPAAPPSPTLVTLPTMPGAIQFENVSFAYDNRTTVLDRLNFVAAGGSMTAIVGRSGAGKSTVLNLIARLYDPVGGKISIAGQDIKSVSMNSLRRNIAIVSQETTIFDDTLLNNIRYGRQNASDSEVEAIAALVGVSDFCVPLRDGLLTQVGERGLRLSGGQRQLIGIARALLKDAPILLLDEPTSFQDAQSEQTVQTALRQLMVGRTTIVAAHRLKTVRDAAAILVLEDGHVVESGAHDVLIRRRGLYARLNSFQSGAEPESGKPRMTFHEAPPEGGV